MEAVSVLAGMPKYPVEEKQFKFFCRMMARFMQTVEITHECPEDPEWTKKYGLGVVNPMNHTIETVAEGCTFFPSLAQWRRIYCKWFRPLDGKWPADIEEQVEE
jgi:hypothetical protein